MAGRWRWHFSGGLKDEAGKKVGTLAWVGKARSLGRRKVVRPVV
jgi:hypothetical protein